MKYLEALNECHNCGLCCCSTQMELSLEDIRRIESLEYLNMKLSDFAIFQDGFYILKNIDNFCVFFDKNTKNCIIYKNRPMGCKFYPLIYDLSNKNCVLDKDCPFRDKFLQRENKMKEYCISLRNWVIKFLL